MSTRSSDTVMHELDALLTAGAHLVHSVSEADEAVGGDYLASLMIWVSRAGNIIRKLGGEASVYNQLYQSALTEADFNFIHSGHCGHIAQIYGALKGLQQDAKAGLLVDLRRLLQADIFADFLEMAEHLLHEGYKDAAAVLIGSVLEDSLRNLADARRLPTAGPNANPLTMDPLNISLTKAAVYQSLTQKQITSWAHVRNCAAHGDYGKYSDADVKQIDRK